MVEKPEPEVAPSNLAIIGRYILTPDIFNIIRETKPGKGEKGDKGDTGDTGATGPQGPKGDKGDKGDVATIQPGQTTTLSPGTLANVINSGSQHNAIFDFFIPQGEKGDVGPEGPSVSNIDGGSANSIYLHSQIFDGGTA